MEHTLDIDAPIVCEIMYYLIQTTHYATGCDSEFIYSNVSYSSFINIWSTYMYLVTHMVCVCVCVSSCLTGISSPLSLSTIIC